MKKIASLFLCCAVALTIIVPAKAANTFSLNFYSPGLDHEESLISISSADLAVSGTKFTDAAFDIIIPTYVSTTPVTATLIAGYDGTYTNRDYEKDGEYGVKANIESFGVNSLSLGNGTFGVKEYNSVFPEGKVTYWTNDDIYDMSKGTTVSITDFLKSKDQLGEQLTTSPCYHKGATITLTEPGYYRVYSNWEELYGTCQGIIEIKSADKSDSSASKTDLPFTDIAASSYCHDAVKWAVEKNITAGTTSTTFSPNTTCTQGQILTFLWRANGSPKSAIKNPYSDVTESNYYYNAALWAYEKGIVSSTVLNAATQCTRSQTMSYFWKLAGKPSATQSSSFTDVAKDSDYSKAVDWAVEKGITAGTTATTFNPESTCTRGQIVTFMYRDLAK